ncbi:hypothetical protein TXYLGN1_17310 [Tepidimicrobium xylanilyticum]|nr:hypothetical protein EN5CB1_09520 [Tepidimicrobium xylanilyticum]
MKPYLNSYEKNNTSSITGKTMEELEEITEVLLNYLKDGLDGQVLSPYFNEREIRHMEDVQYLFEYGYILKQITFIISMIIIGLLLIKEGKKSLGIALFYGPFIWHGSFLLLFLLSLLDFNKYFTYFHLIFFSNDLWLLNPKTDLLIQMLPENFFINIFIRIVLLFLFLLSIIQIIGFRFMKKGNDHNERIVKF